MARKSLTTRQVKKFAREYLNYLEQERGLPIEQAYVFGSYAKRKPRNWSDIDLCIVSKKFKRVDALEYLWTRRRDIDVARGIEPVGMQPDDFVDENPLANEVKKTGWRL